MSRYSDITGERPGPIIYVGDIATDGAAEGLLFVTPCDCEVTIKATVSANAAASTVSYSTITIYDGGTTGTSATSLGTLTTQTTPYTDNTLRTVLTLSGTDYVAEAHVMRFAVSQASGGVALPDLTLAIFYSPVG